MRSNKQILKIITMSKVDCTMWLGLIQANITNHDILGAMALDVLQNEREEEFPTIEAITV